MEEKNTLRLSWPQAEGAALKPGKPNGMELSMDPRGYPKIRVAETPYELLEFQSGFFLATDGTYKGILDWEGNEVVPVKWREVEILPKDGPPEVFVLRPEGEPDSKWYFADTDGQIKSPLLGGRVRYEYHKEAQQLIGFREGVGLIRDKIQGMDMDDEGKFWEDVICGVDIYGNKLFESWIDYNEKTRAVYEEAAFYDGWVLLTNDLCSGFYYLEKGGKATTELFSEAHRFSEGLAAVKEYRLFRHSRRLGYIGQQGEWVIQPEFSEASDFQNGYALVKTPKGEEGIIDQMGRWCDPPGWTIVSPVSPDGYAVAKKRGGNDAERYVVNVHRKVLGRTTEHTVGCSEFREGIMTLYARDGDKNWSYRMDRHGRVAWENSGVCGGVYYSEWGGFRDRAGNAVCTEEELEKDCEHPFDRNDRDPEFYRIKTADRGLSYDSHHIICHGYGTPLRQDCCPAAFNALTDGLFCPDEALAGTETFEKWLWDSSWQVGMGVNAREKLNQSLGQLRNVFFEQWTSEADFGGGMTGSVYFYTCPKRELVTPLCAEWEGKRVSFDILVQTLLWGEATRFRVLASPEIEFGKTAFMDLQSFWGDGEWE